MPAPPDALENRDLAADLRDRFTMVLDPQLGRPELHILVDPLSWTRPQRHKLAKLDSLKDLKLRCWPKGIFLDPQPTQSCSPSPGKC